MFLRPLTLIGIIVSIVTGISLGVLAHLHINHPKPTNAVTTLSSVLSQVTEGYVEDVSESELLEHALQGMMLSLDNHSDFLSAKSFSALKDQTNGRFGGIGIELGKIEGHYAVIAPLDHSPADRAGIKAGDRLIKLDNKSVADMSLTSLSEALRGSPGTELTLQIRREGVVAPLDFELTRAVVQLQSVQHRWLEPGFGYIRLSQFQTSTARDLSAALKGFDATDAANADGLKGLVLDLRNNPGGTLQSSVAVADHFLERGLIVYTEGRLRSSFTKYRATKGDLAAGVPMIVLINGGSASAAEILAGALQDQGRAKLMGTKSFGKGSVQSVLPINEAQAIKITTAYYFTPSGRSIHKRGIEPDFIIDVEDKQLLTEAVDFLKRESAKELQSGL